MIRKHDFGLLTDDQLHVAMWMADLAISSKLTGVLASGRAVVATAHADTELGRVVQSCAVVVAPGDATAFADAIRSLVGDPVRRQTLGAGGTRVCGVASGDGGDFVAIRAGVAGDCVGADWESIAPEGAPTGL